MAVIDFGQEALDQIRITIRKVLAEELSQFPEKGYTTPVDGFLIGKTSGGFTAGVSAVIKIYSGSKGSETDTGLTLSVYNRFADLADDSWVILGQIEGSWEIIAADPCI